MGAAFFTTPPSSPSSGTSASSGSPNFKTDDPTLNSLVLIFQKVKYGDELSSSEVDFLHSSSRTGSSPIQRLRSVMLASAEKRSLQEIDVLAARILDRKIPSPTLLDVVETKLFAKDRPSPRETASLARLIRSCLSRNGSFTESLNNFQFMQGRDPTRGELIDLVADFNNQFLPKISKAGIMVTPVYVFGQQEGHERNLAIVYDREGYLEIQDGPLAPWDISCQQILTTQQKDEMLALYTSLAGDAYYNNLGEFLEFISHFENQKAAHPGLTLEQAYASYDPDLVEVFDKYQSGTCILLSSKFNQELAKRGIQAHSLGKDGINTWSQLPIPGTAHNPVKWRELSREVRGVDHTYSACIYRDEQDNERLITFDCSFDKRNPREVEEHAGKPAISGTRVYLQSKGIEDSEDRPNRIIDAGTIGKARLKGRCKAVMIKDNMILGVDLLRGNFYINSGLASAVTGLTTNARGMVSIELEALANPDEQATYFIDGEPVQLSHREALDIILDKARAHMVLPEDTANNLIALAQNRTELIERFLSQPFSAIKANYADMLAISKKIDEAIALHGKFGYEVTRLIKRYDKAIEPLFVRYDPERAGEQIRALKEEIYQTGAPAGSALG